MPRLFVAVWPPPEVVSALGAIERPSVDGLRWTTPEQWHVTLRFLGSVDDEREVVAAVRSATNGAVPVPVALGPGSQRLGRGILVVPVAGLDALAADVVDATARLGRPPDDRPFHGHVTLARAKRRLPRRVIGLPVAGGWTVEEVAVVASDTRPDGARYHDVARLPLG